MNKLTWAFEIAGVRQAAQQLKDLDALASKVTGRKGVQADDLMRATGGNFSEAFKAANPELMKAFSKSAEAGIGDGLKKALNNTQAQDLIAKWNSEALIKRTQNALRQYDKWGDISQPPPIPGSSTKGWQNILAGVLGGANGNQYLAARALMSGFGVGGGSGGGGAVLVIEYS